MYSFPRTKGKGANRSTGIAILVKKKLASSMKLVAVDSGKGKVKGKAAAIRMVSGQLDYDLGGLYFPPVKSMKLQQYNEVCTGIIKWFDRHLAGLPTRSVPLFAVDLNQDLPNPKDEITDPTVMG